MKSRRDFLTLVGGTAAAAIPGAVWGQQVLPVVGVLEAADQGEQGLSAVLKGLNDAGYEFEYPELEAAFRKYLS